ncbi:hypothetical protein D9M72_490440 [compost metagenome]
MEALRAQIRHLQRHAEALGQPRDQVGLVAGGDLHRVAHFRRVDHMRGERLASEALAGCHRHGGATHAIVGHPAEHAPERQQCHRGAARGQCHGPARRAPAPGLARLTMQCRRQRGQRHRFVQDGIQPAVQRIGLAAPRGDLRRRVRVLRQVRFHRGAARAGQLAIGVGMEIGFVDRGHHFTRCSELAAGTGWAGEPPSSKRRISSRARARRDITVPCGMSSTRAASA